MFADAQIEPVLAHYGADCQPTQIDRVGPGTGFSGAKIWRLTAPRGRLALRRWPNEHPDSERLRFIHDVLWHVAFGGIDFVPAPIRTRRGAGFVESDGHRWELAPWLAGAADYFPARLPEKLSAALAALAKFHLASAGFPLAHGATQSPGVAQRLAQLESLRGGEFQRILDKVTSSATGRGGELAAWAELKLLAPVPPRCSNRPRRQLAGGWRPPAGCLCPCSPVSGMSGPTTCCLRGRESPG